MRRANPRLRLIRALAVLLPPLMLLGAGVLIAPRVNERAAPPPARLVQSDEPPSSLAASTTSLPPVTTTGPAVSDLGVAGPGDAEPAAEAPPAPIGAIALPLPGCPPPPRPPGPPGPPPGAWKPPVLVPETELPEPLSPEEARAGDPTRPGLGAIGGKGMWIWKFRQSEGGDASAIVERAQAAGLSHLWVRVGDSRDGFYAADQLEALIPRAHAAGIYVLGWGFPYLHDPVSDAQWGAAAMAWEGPGGARLDGFSPDLERSTEGVVMTERRARVYLGLLREAVGSRLLIGTIYRPTDRLWSSDYPYTAIAEYVDALAPMVYWGCTEPGAAATQALDRLSTLAPVHMIGQGYDMAAEGGRLGAPSAEETSHFLQVADSAEAVGASFWVWQSMGSEQWGALSRFRWGSHG